jgi:hypothetical protein
MRVNEDAQLVFARSNVSIQQRQLTLASATEILSVRCNQIVRQWFVSQILLDYRLILLLKQLYDNALR